MRQENIFLPVFGLVAWTVIVLTALALCRLKAMFKRQVPASQYRDYKPNVEPAHLQYLSRNYINLLELPILYYVVTIVFYLMHAVDETVINLAWAYLGLRVIHTFIHVTVNYIPARFSVFLLSLLVLLGMWGLLFVRVQAMP